MSINKSLKSKIILIIISIIVVVSGVLMGCIAFFSSKTASGVINAILPPMSKIAATAVQNYINERTTETMIVENDPVLNSPTSTDEEKIAVLKEYAKDLGVKNVGFAKPDGKAISAAGPVDIKDRDYFANAMQGKKFMSDPIVSKQDGSVIIVASAPIYQNDKVAGVVYISDSAEKLSEIVKQINFGNYGHTYIINHAGTTVAHPDFEKVKKADNYINLAKEDKSYIPESNAMQKIIAAKDGSFSYNENGQEILIGFSEILGSNGWKIVVRLTWSAFLGQITTAIIFSLVICAVIVVVASLVAIKLSNNIANPIKKIASRMELLAQGDFSSEVPVVKSKDEVFVLAQSMNTTVGALREYIKEISENLNKMAGGDMRIEIESDYVGEFDPIKQSMLSISDSLNSALSDIQVFANQVSNGADQVSGAAQALSQGATEQASTIEELSASINQIAEQVKQNAKNVVLATEYVNQSAAGVQESNNEMNNMLQSMEEINKSSNEIAKIIKVIDDIAFQTNILALNAAVEAARAGAAGKGFAVVAEEVRNLASRSAEAAKQTTELIERSINTVKKGSQIAEKTAASLGEVAVKSGMVSETIEKVSVASNEQALAIEQINTGVEQISTVVQTNSATAEESAATSEELSAQASQLNQLVAKFKLKGLAAAAEASDTTAKIVLDEQPAATKLTFSNDKY